MPPKFIRILFLFALVCLLDGCHPGIREKITPLNSLNRLKAQAYPIFDDTLDFKELTTSIDRSLTYFKRVPLEREYQYGKATYTAAHMILSLETFKAFLEKEPSSKELNTFIHTLYQVYASAGNADGDVLFTGYYEPTYTGSLTKRDEAVYPVYSRPSDLLEIDLSLFSDQYKGQKRLVARVDESTKRVVPYYSREEINEQDDFFTRAKPLVWLKNRVDRFFLEIQGSGRIDLGNNEILRVHYAGSNGNAYRSVGRYLIEKNEILKENMSMQAIRTWLEFHPERMDEILHHNESFVFFQTEKGGPFGSLGVEVTPLRSIATDSRLFPKGALCFMQARLPDTHRINPIKEWEPASFFVMNQDTGGAIKGASRADLFCGNSNYAAFTAGHMNQYGKLYFLVLKSDFK